MVEFKRLRIATGWFVTASGLVGCTSPGVLQTYPSNIGFATQTVGSDAGLADEQYVKFLTLWKPAPLASSRQDALTVAVWCVKIDASKGGFDKSACAYNVVFEDYKGKNGQTPSIQPIAESFSKCTDSDPDCKQMRDRLYSYLMKTAHSNCLSYLTLVFAAKETTDTAVSATKDFLTGGSITAAAAGSPPVAGGLGLVNLLTNSYERINTSIFEGATARVLADAIDAAQQQYLIERTTPSGSKSLAATKGPTFCSPDQISSANYGQCDVFQVLDFTNGYASTCSLKNGLAFLASNVAASRAQQMAQTAKESSESAVKKVNEVQAATAKILQANSKVDQATEDATAAKVQAGAAKTASEKAMELIGTLDRRLKTLETPPSPAQPASAPAPDNH